MENFKFNTIEDILYSIKNKNFDRNFTSIIGSSYIVDESVIGDFNFKFNEAELSKYSFLFYYFDVEQIGVSDKDFKETIEKILSLGSENINPIEIKKIIYEKELKKLKIKFDKKIISNKIYLEQVKKYIN